MPKWWNGRRAGLKIQYGQPCAGSSPAFGTKQKIADRLVCYFFVSKVGFDKTGWSGFFDYAKRWFVVIKSKKQVCLDFLDKTLKQGCPQGDPAGSFLFESFSKKDEWRCGTLVRAVRKRARNNKLFKSRLRHQLKTKSKRFSFFYLLLGLEQSVEK